MRWPYVVNTRDAFSCPSRSATSARHEQLTAITSAMGLDVHRQHLGHDTRRRHASYGPQRLRTDAFAGPLLQLPLDANRSTEEVDVLDPQRQQLPKPQPEPSLSQHHRQAVRRCCVGQCGDLSHRQRHDTRRTDARNGDPHRGGTRRQHAILHRGPQGATNQPDE
jgi:hypothetical protein